MRTLLEGSSSSIRFGQPLFDARLVHVDGNLTRAENQDRIDFLAQVRNAALEPLWIETAEPDEQNMWSVGQPSRSKRMWEADKVIFANDVYFCARDAIRLLLHNADMSCGLDFDRKKLDQIPNEVGHMHQNASTHGQPSGTYVFWSSALLIGATSTTRTLMLCRTNAIIWGSSCTTRWGSPPSLGSFWAWQSLCWSCKQSQMLQMRSASVH